jgi:hypothetical protein
MNSKALIGISILVNFIVCSRILQLYIWPRLRQMSREDALNALVVPHMIRFMGLSFLMPGVVSPLLSPQFAKPAAYGDFIAAILAIITSYALSARASWAIAMLWILNIEGASDLLFAYYQGIIGIGLPPGVLGSAFYIPTVIVPPLLVSHAVMIWLLLLQPEHRAQLASTAA